jgi:hypothetical protein
MQAQTPDDRLLALRRSLYLQADHLRGQIGRVSLDVSPPVQASRRKLYGCSCQVRLK